MTSWAERVHRRAADFGSVMTSCGHPGSSAPAYPYRLEKVKFGVPLEEVCKNNDNIPGPLLVLILKLNKESPNRRDVFRAPGHQGAMKKLIHFLQAGRLVNVDNYSVFTIASVLKKFLRKIPHGIFGRSGEEELFAIIDLEDELEQTERLHRLLATLPKYTQHLLVLLFGTFRVIASNALHAGTGMTSEALGVSVAPSFFQSCVSDGKTARMEDVLKFKVATKIMKHIIDGFSTDDIFGRDNYEYYARVTGRILKVKDEWICNFQHPPPPRGKLAKQKYALQHSLEAEKTWLQCQCERWGLLAQEESRSTPALLTSSSSALENSVLSLGVTPEHSFMESCARLSVSLEGPGLYAMTSSPVPKRADSIGGKTESREEQRQRLSFSNAAHDDDDDVDDNEDDADDDDDDDACAGLDLTATDDIYTTTYTRSDDDLDGGGRAFCATSQDDSMSLAKQIPKKNMLHRSNKLRTIRSGNRNLLTVAAAQLHYDDDDDVEETAATSVKRRYRQNRKKNVSSASTTTAATQMRLQQQQQRVQRDLLPSPIPKSLRDVWDNPTSDASLLSGDKLKNPKPSTSMGDCSHCQRGVSHSTAYISSTENGCYTNKASLHHKFNTDNRGNSNINNNKSNKKACGDGNIMTLDELRVVNRYAESTRSLSYLPQVHERQTARMLTRSEWFLGPRDDVSRTSDEDGNNIDIHCSLGNLATPGRNSSRCNNCLFNALQQQQQQQHNPLPKNEQTSQYKQQEQYHHYRHDHQSSCGCSGGRISQCSYDHDFCRRTGNIKHITPLYKQQQISRKFRHHKSAMSDNSDDNEFMEIDDNRHQQNFIHQQYQHQQQHHQEHQHEETPPKHESELQEYNERNSTTSTVASETRAPSSKCCNQYVDTKYGSYYNFKSIISSSTCNISSSIIPSPTVADTQSPSYNLMRDTLNSHCYNNHDDDNLNRHRKRYSYTDNINEIPYLIGCHYQHHHNHCTHDRDETNHLHDKNNLCKLLANSYIDMTLHKRPNNRAPRKLPSRKHHNKRRNHNHCSNDKLESDDNDADESIVESMSDDYDSNNDVMIKNSKCYYSTECLQANIKKCQAKHLSMSNLLSTDSHEVSQALHSPMLRRRQLAAFASKSQPNLYNANSSRIVAVVAPLNVSHNTQNADIIHDNVLDASGAITAPINRTETQDSIDYVPTARHRHTNEPHPLRRFQRLRARRNSTSNHRGMSQTSNHNSSRTNNNFVTVIFNVLDFLF